MLALSSGQEKKSSILKTKALIVAPKTFIVGHVKGYELLISGSVMGAAYWLYNCTDQFIKELWLDTEIPMDTLSNNKVVPYGHPKALDAGLALVDMLEEFPAPTLERIRLLTKNYWHLEYTRKALGGRYNLCLNGPKNQRIWPKDQQP